MVISISNESAGMSFLYIFTLDSGVDQIRSVRDISRLGRSFSALDEWFPSILNLTEYNNA